jgi:hypothetical protein
MTVAGSLSLVGRSLHLKNMCVVADLRILCIRKVVCVWGRGLECEGYGVFDWVLTSGGGVASCIQAMQACNFQKESGTMECIGRLWQASSIVQYVRAQLWAVACSHQSYAFAARSMQHAAAAG